MKLGELIKSYRDTHDLSQRQFAACCELSNGYISILEKGVNPKTGKPITPTIPQLKKLADGMGITVTQMLEQVEDMPVDLTSAISIFDAIEDEDQSSLFHVSANRADALTPTEQTMIHKFRSLDDRGQAAVLNVLDHEYNSLPGSAADTAPKEAR